MSLVQTDRDVRLCARALALCCALASTGPALADWLVMQDGTRLETRGPWETRGKQVLFTDTAGTFTSLRLSQVDLEASRAASEADETAPPAETELPAEETRLEPALVLTSADVRRLDPKAIQAALDAKAPKVVMYTTEWCPVCKKAKSFLRQLGVPFLEKDVEKSVVAKREYVALFGPEVRIPALVIGSETLRGFSAVEIRAALARLEESSKAGRPPG